MVLMAIYDKETKRYDAFQVLPNAITYARAVEQTLQEPKHIWKGYENAFDIVQLARIDEKTGEVEQDFQRIANLGDLVKKTTMNVNENSLHTN